MNQDLSIIELVLHASIVDKIVIAGLLLMSLVSWGLIFSKLGSLGHIEQPFCSGKRLTDRYSQASNQAETGPLERLFSSGMREFMKLRDRGLDTATQLDGARRAMKASLQRELDAIEGNLGFLASVGSVSPYVGLFGTVWGIMNAFVGLSNMTQVTLATVAPGIAEALVATAIGLFSAIPAVVAYNRFARDIDRIATALDSFSDEFSNILQRNAAAPQGAAGT